MAGFVPAAAQNASASTTMRAVTAGPRSTRLNGVSATRRKRVNPASATTSRIRAGPAWAPSASPTSCDSDAGVHSSVENP